MSSNKERTKSRRTKIEDRFKTYGEVQQAIKQVGVESSSLIFGIDYTMSNIQQGKRTFGGRSLHTIEANHLNPYQEVILTLGETLESFDDDGIIPAFGFGDVQTRDKGVFPLSQQTLKGFREVFEAYNRVTPHVQMAGPTSFAPIIQKAIEITKQEKGVCNIRVSL